MGKEPIKEIIIALINNGYFPKYDKDEVENYAKDIAKFINTMNQELS